MKKLIFSLLAVACVVCGVNANEVQEIWCGDKNLSYCMNHFDRQCNAKNYYACFVMGNLNKEQERYYESKKYYELVCDKANSKDSFQIKLIDGNLAQNPAIEIIRLSCGVLAVFYDNGWGVRQDYSKKLQYFKKACNLGDANSCGGAGLAYYLGKGTKMDLKLAKSYLEKSCEMESGLGCYLLSAMYYNGDGVQQNFSKAKELSGKACDLGEQKGCDGYKELKEKGIK